MADLRGGNKANTALNNSSSSIGFKTYKTTPAAAAPAASSSPSNSSFISETLRRTDQAASSFKAIRNTITSSFSSIIGGNAKSSPSSAINSLRVERGKRQQFYLFDVM